jgi:hypothetical protein
VDPAELAYVIEQSLVGIDCQPNSGRGHSCRYPDRGDHAPRLFFAPESRRPPPPGVTPSLRIRCRFWLED